jgi:hypothetical protein
MAVSLLSCRQRGQHLAAPGEQLRRHYPYPFGVGRLAVTPAE